LPPLSLLSCCRPPLIAIAAPHWLLTPPLTLGCRFIDAMPLLPRHMPLICYAIIDACHFAIAALRRHYYADADDA